MLRTLFTTACAAALSVTLGTTAMAEAASGAYLAGRHAAVRSDFRMAARFYAEALREDPQNVELMESAALSYLSLGQIEKALPLAKALDEEGQRSQIAHMLLIAGWAKDGDYRTLLDSDPDQSGIGPWVDGLVRAWAHMGAGDMTAALAQFDALSAEAGMQGFVNYHRALALASVGDFEGAEAIFEDDLAGSVAQTRRGILVRAEVLGQLGRYEDALDLLELNFGESTDPELEELVAALEAEKPFPYSQVPDVTAGIAEIFYTFASVLRSEAAGDYYVLLYSRIARYLRPDHIDALLLTADLLENLEQYGLAIREYKEVPSDDPAYHVAELGRADALRRLGEEEEAIQVLEQLTRIHGDLAVVHSTLGDMLRAKEEYTAAIDAYDRALAATGEGLRTRWLLFYSRGIAYERLGDLAAAEKDFRSALEINPEQPQVLNYLGYSLVEQQRNLDEALDMIERAVAASPDSGYIVDSLGWVLYRLGRYDEAVEQMERAVELVPIDPVVNDHLGDVYWAVGREREAQFQWRRALSFIDDEGSDTEADAERIRRKLDIGLDAVLAEEGAPPLKVSARK
ncbi:MULTISPECIES: tetratricopeptide repeat protein [unclassified Sulfitobacter]|uniref:tetratricopeptide repeat protein n=1 Tax=unclassified Sulfitobacter TaxID=196795 RepID=UPI0007C32A3B|nr:MULTISPECIES: tetratricopeptide repeat protein [unclassified Sulfitobacter]KZY03849.1 hypothetical protein A3721_17595 [Sulfitobacter sp. HI0023]KZY22708.1 hypothetical protein A3728_10160 [Sulfitobacter sp. HI0040]KZZ69411.1 hypothetical protein A3764_10950 [Sulfitobacter sp. HI0129]